MVFINVLIVDAAPHFVFPRCLNTSDDFLYPACRGLAGLGVLPGPVRVSRLAGCS